MNQLQYRLLSKVVGERKLDGHYLENLWQDYCFYSEQYSFPIFFCKSDFVKIFSTTYDVLGLRISEEESKFVLNHYLGLLEQDAIDGSLVDVSWAIDHIWYCSIGNIESLDAKKYNDCIPFVQDRLMKEFQIMESFTDKVKRKVNVTLTTSGM